MKRSTTRTRLAIIAALVVVTLAVYGQVATFDFVRTDDTLYVTQNPHVLGGLTLANATWAFTTFAASNWHPVTWLSLMLDAEIGGPGPRTYHLTNLVLHLLNTLLLFWLMGKMTRRAWPSAFVAAAFAVHPLHVESVAWIAERKDVLSTAFWLLTCLVYLRYVKRPGPVNYTVVVLLFALGLMSKPMLVTLPFVLLLLDYWPLGRLRLRNEGPVPSRWRPVLEKLPLLALAATSCVVTLRAQWSVVAGLEHYPLTVRIANASVSYVAYIWKTLWPVGLAMPYPYDAGLSPSLVAGSAVVLLVVTVLVVARAERSPYLVVGWFWYLGTLVPVIGLAQVGNQPMADRYTYVPLIGLFVMIAYGASELLGLGNPRSRNRRIAAAVVAGTVVLAWMSIAHAQARHWRNSEALFTRAVEVTDRNVVAHNGLGRVMEERGRIDEAVAHYRESLGLRPGDGYAMRRLSGLLVRTGKLEQAAGLYQDALETGPASAGLHSDLASLLARLGRYEAAARHFESALQLGPGDATTHANFGVTLTRLGRLEEASGQFRDALRLHPELVQAHKGLAIVLARQGDADTAITHLNRAVELSPGDTGALSNLATLLLKQGRLQEAGVRLDELLFLDPANAKASRQLESLRELSRHGGVGR